MSSQVFVGIDVANAPWDMALRPTGERWAVTKDDPGIAAPVTRLPEMAPQLMGLEAPGSSQWAVVTALVAAGLPVVVVHPRHARDVATATGPLAQTDVLEARALAHLADAVRPAPHPQPDAQTEELRALLARRWTSSPCGQPNGTGSGARRAVSTRRSRRILPGSTPG